MRERVKSVIRAYRRHGKKTDPFGSYTGNNESGEKPIQDVDDL